MVDSPPPFKLHEKTLLNDINLNRRMANSSKLFHISKIPTGTSKRTLDGVSLQESPN